MPGLGHSVQTTATKRSYDDTEKSECARCGIVTELQRLVDTGDDIVNELFNIDVSMHSQATTASRNATYMWTEMKKRAGNANFQWRDFIALSAGHNCIEVQNELVTQTHGRGVLGYMADTPLNLLQLANLDRDQCIDQSVIDHMLYIVCNEPSFLNVEAYDAICISAGSLWEWPATEGVQGSGFTNNTTARDAFKKQNGPEWGIIGCRYLLHAHCYEMHWTFVAIDLTQKRVIFFDPYHGQVRRLVSHLDSMVNGLCAYIESIAIKNAQAYARVNGMRMWDRVWAQELKERNGKAIKLPKQEPGGEYQLGCALHVIAFAIDLITDTHDTLNDEQAYAMRSWVKMILTTATVARLTERMDVVEAQECKTTGGSHE